MYKLELFISDQIINKFCHNDVEADTIEECKALVTSTMIPQLICLYAIGVGIYDLEIVITQDGEYVDRDEGYITVKKDGTFEISDEYHTDCRYFAYNDEDDCESDGFKNLDDAIEYAKSHNLPVVKVHNYFYDESGKIRPDGYPETVWTDEPEEDQKHFDINFTLSSPACFVVSASSKEEAEEEGERMLGEKFSREEIMAKMMEAFDYGGVSISSVVPLDEEDEEEEEIKIRPISASICGLFEELLERHDIYIPDEDREGNEEEACLYGSTYYELEDSVTEILLSLMEKLKKNPDAEINDEDF